MVPRRSRPRIWLAIYRRLSGLYPPSLRRDLGAEMEILFLDLYSEAREDGRVRAAWFAVRACIDALARAFQAHGDPDSPTGAYIVRSVISDLRFAWQVASRQRRHTLAVVLTVAIGIGATTAVFSVADAAILRRLPFPESHRLVDIAHRSEAGWSIYSQDAASFRAWGERPQLFDFIGGYATASFVGRIADEPHEIDAVRISPGLLSILGARPIVGRLLTEQDAAEGAAPAVLVSDRVWEREFASDPAVAGQFLTLDETRYQVVGVLPRAFAFPFARTDLWVATDPTAPGARMRAMGRLAPGLDLEAGREMAEILAAGLADATPREEGWNLALIPLDDQRTTRSTRTALVVALAAAGLLLLVAIVNVAQVTLARAIQREGELSVRAALGAGRRRIVRQVMCESLLMSACGGALGIVIARGLVAMIVIAAPENLLRLDALRIGIDWRAFVVAFVLAGATGLGAGLFPAWNASRQAISASLGNQRQGLSPTRGRRRLQSGLIVAETALCLVLLAGAGLLLNSYQRLSRVDPGFDADRLLSLVLQLDQDRYPTPETRLEMLDRLALRIRQIPGVEATTAAGGAAPMPGGAWLADSIEVDTGEGIDESTVLPYANVSEGFFATVGVEITEGRPLTAEDHDTENVVVGAPLAGRLFGTSSPLGRRLRIDDNWWTVVGVASPTSTFSLVGEEDDLQVYLPLKREQTPRSYAGVIIRATGDPAALIPKVRQVLWEIDPAQPVRSMELGSETMAEWVVEPRFNLLLFATFAGVALVLVLVGIAGVVGHVVASRTREIGIRVAMGANDRSILTMATLGGLRPVMVGLGLGGIVVWQTTRFIRSLLFFIEPNDPATLISVATVFLVATFVASYVPARSAVKIDPVRALRAE